MRLRLVPPPCMSPASPFSGPLETDVPLTAGGDAVLLVREPGTCFITEPLSGGATTVSIVCQNPGVGVTCTAAPGSLVVNMPSGGTVDVIVTNDYSPPPPLPPRCHPCEP